MAVVSHATQWFADAARKPDDPWCLNVGLVAPDLPLIVPQEYLDTYPLDSLPPFKLHTLNGLENHPWAAKQGFALCSFLDDNIGKLIAALEANGQLDDTTIIYTSDHGDNVGARGLWGKSNM
ncbi:sulfatase-like hydrolase/transferase [Paracoccus sp. Z330]|uniref:Sulfatase-like hydrolase/transferase n=1 Tax=Paracoccus onchidii TaxID=3017813 RepID=A0ABT4ZJQ9_9RHOB|nr:sulfatase-like hydrolase/transferase [Paracoccus onchidii]MDB6179606.1 sulfatase-like hydrolase/transferase [Paracoccus onchidii]